MNDRDFQHDVLEKLGRVEAKMEMVIGNGRPGRMTLVEERIVEPGRGDVRPTLIERFVDASLALLISAAAALHVHWWR